jgi:hypothetical protein
MAARTQGRISKRYRLKGPYAGKDCVLCGHLFQAGELDLSLTATEHASLAKVLWFYQAEEVDDGKRDVQADEARDVGGEVRPDGEDIEADTSKPRDGGGVGEAQGVDEGRGLVPGGNGQAESIGRLRMALLGLDPSVDAHWTPSGKPSLKAIEAAFGKPVTRAQIETALPGLTRKGLG